MNAEKSADGSRKNKTHVRLAVLLLGLLAVGAFFSYWTVRQADRQMRTDLLQQARLVSQGVKVGSIQALSGTEADLTNPDYLRIKEQLVAVRSANPQCRFVYLLGRKPDGAFFFLVDSEPVGSAGYSPPGQLYPEAGQVETDVFTTVRPFVQGPSSDRWGGMGIGAGPDAQPPDRCRGRHPGHGH